MSGQQPSGNPTPLEKTLMHMDLSKGVNERDRPETANPVTALTRLENLVQDQGGAYIKRPGNTSLGLLDTGAAYTPAKLMRLRDGLGMVDDAFNFYQYQESTSKFRARGVLPEFAASTDLVVSSGASVTPVIYSAGSSTLFHFMTHNAGQNTANGINTIYLSIYDRQSGSVVAQYDLSVVLGGSVSSAVACFVDNRYLHVAAAGSTVKSVFIIDTQAAFPAAAAIIPIALGGGPGSASEAEPGVGRSYFLIGNSGNAHPIAVTNAGAVTVGTAFGIGIEAHIGFSGTQLWVMTATNIGSLDSATLATSIALAAHGATVANFTICADRSQFVWCAAESTTTFGATTVTSVSFLKTTAANGTTLSAPIIYDGWRIGTSPFEALLGTAFGVFIQLYKDSSVSPVPACVVPMDATVRSTPTALGNAYSSVRVSAVVEPFLAVRNTNGYIKAHASDRTSTAANEFSIGVATQVQARGFGYSMCVLRPSVALSVCQTFAGVNYISGGAHCFYGGGQRPVEVGFIDVPRVSAQVGAAGTPNGAYKYLLQFRYTDETGAVTWSRTSPIEAITLANVKGTITMSAPSVTSKDSPQGASAVPPSCSVELYRTKAGGTQYYLNASSAAGTPSSGTATQVAVLGAARLYTVTDNMSDATLASQPTLFRQPGTPNAGLDRYPPPAGNLLCQHRDRLFTVDTYGNRVCYSSFYVDGETAWFNPAFSFFAHGGSGRITGLVSMDGRLFIFKRDSIFVVDGDGPGEGGVVGNEFSPPQRLATEYGCIDHRSIVVTSDGIVYRSMRGIELLTRGLKVNWIGDRVWNTVDNNPVTLGAVLDTSGRVHMCLAASTGKDPAAQDQIVGVEVVYDSTTDSWTTYYGDPGTGYGKCQKSTVMANLYNLGEVQCYANATMCTYADGTSGLDGNASFPPSVVETGWIRTGQQVRQRISDAYFLAKKTGNHAVRISAAYDFVDTYTQTFTWQPDVINALTIEQLCLQLVKPHTLAVRLLVECIAATDQAAYPSGTGRACAVLGLTFQVAPMAGAPTVSALAQGYVPPPPTLQTLNTELDVALETELSVTITTES